MESSRALALLGAVLVLLLGVSGQEETELQPRALDLYSAMEDTSHEKELVNPPARKRSLAGEVRIVLGSCLNLFICKASTC